MSANKLKVATLNESVVAKLIGGVVTTAKHEFDVLNEKKGIAIEVKTVFPGVKHDKITMHPQSIERKQMFIKAEKYKKAYTVIFDMRDDKDVCSKRFGIF